MSTRGLPRSLFRAAPISLVAGLLSFACGEAAPTTGVQIAISNGAGVPAPEYLLLDWHDSQQRLVADRRVPETGALDPGRDPLAVVRIAATGDGDPERRFAVRGMRDGRRISSGGGSARVVPGSWQMTSVVLALDPGPADADAGVGPDAGAIEGGVPDAAGLPEAGPSRDTAALDTTVPVDAPDGSPDLPAAADMGRELAPDLPPTGPVTLAAIADSYVEQGAPGTNHGKATILEVKKQEGANNNRIAYLRFSVAGLTAAEVVSANLRLHGRASIGNTVESVYAVTDETWTETGINWTNKPPMMAKLFTAVVATTSVYREWPVTAHVKAQLAAGRDSVSVAVAMDMDIAAGPDIHSSREAATNQPQLVINR